MIGYYNYKMLVFRETALMNIKKFTLAILLSLTLTPFAGFADDRPGWVPNGRHTSYNPKQYLIGIGIAPATTDSGEDIQKADNAARADVAKQIRVSLSEDLSTHEENVSETGYGKKVASEEHSKFKITLKNRQWVNMTVEGVEIAERYFDQNASLNYSLAVLNKTAASERLSGEAAAGFRESDATLKDAEKSINNGNYVDGIIKLITATDLFDRARENNKIACVLGAEAIKSSSFTNPFAMLLDVAGKIEIKCESGCHQKARIGDSLPETVLVKAVYSSKQAIIPHLPLKLIYSDEKTTRGDTFLTSSDGTASIKTDAIKKTGRKNNTIEVVPAWEVLEKYALGKNADSWQERLSSEGAAISYETRSETSTTILISSCLKIDGRPEEDTVAIDMLKGQLREAGFIVSTMDDCLDLKDIDAISLRINGKAELVAIIDMDAMRSTKSARTVYRAGVSFSCYDMHRKEITASMKGVAVGMANEEREAVDRAIANACSESGKLFVEKIRENLR
jgi:hypothetical protein